MLWRPVWSFLTLWLLLVTCGVEPIRIPWFSCAIRLDCNFWLTVTASSPSKTTEGLLENVAMCKTPFEKMQSGKQKLRNELCLICNDLTVHFASIFIYRSQKALQKMLNNFPSSTEEDTSSHILQLGERQRLQKVRELSGLQMFSIHNEELGQLSLDSCLGTAAGSP